jgi:hypothetical protein
MELESVKNALSGNEQNFIRQLRNKLFTEYMLVNNAPKAEEAPVEEAKPANKTAAKKTTTTKKTTTKKTTKKVEAAE